MNFFTSRPNCLAARSTFLRADGAFFEATNRIRAFTQCSFPCLTKPDTFALFHVYFESLFLKNGSPKTMVKLKAKKPLAAADEKRASQVGCKSPPKLPDRNQRRDSFNTAVPKTDPLVAGPVNSLPGGRHNGEPASSNGSAPPLPGNSETIRSQSGIDLTEKIKELVRLAQEQGYLTWGHQRSVARQRRDTRELDEIYIKLRNLDLEIVDQAEVDRVKQPEPEEEEDKSRLDILDDPVRMYLKQMGQVPLLTREQEVEISKRIEDAENEVKKIIYGFGFAGKEHIALAEKLVSEPPKERFDRVILDKKIEGREKHLKALRKLVKDVRVSDQWVDEKYTEWQNAPNRHKRDKHFADFRKVDDKLQRTFSKFYYKQKVIEEMALVADNIHDKIQLSLRTIEGTGGSAQMRPATEHHPVGGKEDQSAGEFVRMPHLDYLESTSNCSTTPGKRCRPRPRWWKPASGWSSRSPRNTPIGGCHFSI